MKNKKNIYILLPAVILIWGVLIYKIIRGLNPSLSFAQSAVISKTFKPEKLKESQSFTIRADYRDPFLGTTEKKKKKIITKKKNIATVKDESIPFPQIIFKGVVTPKGNNEEVFLIIVNGQQHLFKKKSTYDGVTLLLGNNKQVTLQFQDQKQSFPLEK
mgnify:CR=1 FL=1